MYKWKNETGSLLGYSTAYASNVLTASIIKALIVLKIEAVSTSEYTIRLSSSCLSP